MVQQLRSFNRLVTQRVGALDDRFLARARPLGEARVLWEIGEEGCDLRLLRARLVTVHYGALAAKHVSSAPARPRGALPAEAWLALGAVPLGPWVLRADLAERAGEILVRGEDPTRFLGSLGVPKRERQRVAAALARLLEGGETPRGARSA